MITTNCDCGFIIPGTDGLVNGRNIAQYDALSVRSKLSGIAILPLFALTCNNNITWTNPITKQTYDVPDQIETTIQLINSSVMNAQTISFKTTNDVRAFASKQLKIEPLVGMFSASESWKQHNGIISTLGMMIGYSSSHTNYFVVTLKPSETMKLFLSDEAKLFVSEFVSKYPLFNETSIDVYEKFITQFGTHYVKSLTGGGKFEFPFATPFNILHTMSQTSINLNAEHNFLNLIERSIGRIGTEYEVNQEWLNASITDFDCFGGLGSCPQSESTFNEWTKSIFANPWPLNVTMEKISTLMPKAIQTQFDMAVTNYLIKKYIKYETIPFLTNFIFQVNAKYVVNAQCFPMCANLSYFGHVMMDSTKPYFDETLTKYKTNLRNLITEVTNTLSDGVILTTQKLISKTKFIDFTNSMSNHYSQYQKIVSNDTQYILCTCTCEYCCDELFPAPRKVNITMSPNVTLLNAFILSNY